MLFYDFFATWLSQIKEDESVSAFVKRGCNFNCFVYLRNKAFIRNWNYPTDKENYLKRVQTIVSRKTKIVAIQGELLKEINLNENT